MIKFSVCRYKNFLSTGDYWNEIDFLKNKTTAISGKNGSGKSTILDALCFGLFGKPFRKINKPNLINSINNSKCLVEVEFSSGKKKYKIVRGQKPNIFEIHCDGILINQDSKTKDYQEYLENTILKFNLKSFTQIVILGSASFTPFMQLNPQDRREIIEDLLDIQIFSSMNTIVKEKLLDIKEAISNTKYNLELVTDKIDLQKHNIKINNRNIQSDIDSKLREISNNYSQITKTNDKMIELTEKVTNLNLLVVEKNNLEASQKKMFVVHSRLEGTQEKIEKDIHFYEENDDCPICRQKIEVGFRNLQIQEKKSKKVEVESATLKLNSEIDKIKDKLNEIREYSSQIMEASNKIVNLQSEINSINRTNVRLNTEIQELKSRTNDGNEQTEKLKELQAEKKKLDKELEKHITDRQYYDVCHMLLKDTGIKTKIIKQYIPIMNKLINKYLNDMDFFVSFNLDENFEETIKSRHHDIFSYANFSEGEKMKIDLALLFAWRHISKLKNSTNTNLLMLDEIFDSSLDSNAMDAVLKLFDELSKDTNLFVISHRGDQLTDKFESQIVFSKKNNFSRMETV